MLAKARPNAIYSPGYSHNRLGSRSISHPKRRREQAPRERSFHAESRDWGRIPNIARLRCPRSASLERRSAGSRDGSSSPRRSRTPSPISIEPRDYIGPFQRSTSVLRHCRGRGGHRGRYLSPCNPLCSLTPPSFSVAITSGRSSPLFAATVPLAETRGSIITEAASTSLLPVATVRLHINEQTVPSLRRGMLGVPQAWIRRIRPSCTVGH